MFERFGKHLQLSLVCLFVQNCVMVQLLTWSTVSNCGEFDSSHVGLFVNVSV